MTKISSVEVTWPGWKSRDKGRENGFQLQESKVMLGIQRRTHIYQTSSRRKTSWWRQMHTIVLTRVKTSWATKLSLRQSSMIWSRKNGRLSTRKNLDWMKKVWLISRPPRSCKNRPRERCLESNRVRSMPPTNLLTLAYWRWSRRLIMLVKLRSKTSRKSCQTRRISALLYQRSSISTKMVNNIIMIQPRIWTQTAMPISSCRMMRRKDGCPMHNCKLLRLSCGNMEVTT